MKSYMKPCVFSDERDSLLEKWRFENLRKDIAAGLEQVDKGELIDGKIVFGKLRQKAKFQ